MKRFGEILALTADEPAIRDWVARHPLKALRFGQVWTAVVAAYRWINAERDSGRYLREISAAGVDTKFVDTHRALLAELLDVPGSSSGFLSALGLRAKPEMVRLRAHTRCRPFSPFSEVILRLEELSAVDVVVKMAVIIENEITYLSLPVPTEGVVIWGKGFEVNRVGALPWLRDADVWVLGRSRHPRIRDPQPASRPAAADPLVPDGPRDPRRPP